MTPEEQIRMWSMEQAVALSIRATEWTGSDMIELAGRIANWAATGQEVPAADRIETPLAHPILDLPMDPERNDAKASTIREYLKALLTALWNEGDGFSSKRPLGNSSWEYELHVPLIQAGLIPGGRVGEEYGEVLETDETVAAKLIFDAIRDL